MGTAGLIKCAREKVKELNVGELQKAGFLPLDGQYFPAILYPPITMYPPMKEEELFEGYRNRPANPLVVYAHIPFCINWCTFCHFAVKVGAPSKEKDDYLDALEKEMDLYMDRLGLETIPAQAVNVGGGTATCLAPPQLNRFLDSFTKRLDLTSCSQFTYDVDPTTLLGTQGLERLNILRSYGGDRITIGAQSFDDEILKKMNRVHTGKDVLKAIQQARQAGFESICIDLIYGYPGQTLEGWVKDMETVVSLDIESFQLYRLRIIPAGLMPGLILSWFNKNPYDFPSLEETLIMKELGFLISSQNGYSDKDFTRVFSKKHKDISLYNEANCCKLFDVIGFGFSSFSNLRDRIGIKTFRDIKEYCSLVNQGKIPIERGKVRTKDDEIRRNAIGPLKNMREVYKDSYERATGVALNKIFLKKIKRLKDFNLLSEDEKKIMLTTRGHFFADEVCIQFFHPDYIPFPKQSYADGQLNPYRDGG